jgi:RNA polymerase sigma-70 factor, ECF subfamily
MGRMADAQRAEPAQAGDPGPGRPDGGRSASFERVVLLHAGPAYRLARWLTRDEHDAEDVLQEATLRAFKYFDGFQGSDARLWLLSIVRNTFYTRCLRQSASPEGAAQHAGAPERGRNAPEPEGESPWAQFESEREPPPDEGLLRECDQQLVDESIRALPPEYREVIVFRELEELSYKQIAAIAGIPIGTVMSRLSRAREQLRRELLERLEDEDER